MDRAEGYVYILTSPNTEYVKIGGTDYPPLKRIREVNSTEPYKSLGPWSLADFRQVKDWHDVESSIHYAFRSRISTEIERQKELFSVSKEEFSLFLDSISPDKIINKPKIDRMFQDSVFLSYIKNIFKFTGILNWMDIQGAWTFVLFPSTNGGRYFTINIGGHEVSFSTLGRKSNPQVNMLLVDKLILDFKETIDWIEKRHGEVCISHYKRALPRSVSIFFEGGFEDANNLLMLSGVRRALIAYWNELLIQMKENGKLNLYARYHNWNAVARLHKMISSGLGVAPA